MAAKEQLGVALPASLTRLLRERDGGVSNYLAYHVGETYASLPSFFGVAEIISSFLAAGEFGTPQGVVAIGSSAHSWLGLDYRSAPEPAVIYQEDEDSPIVVLATSFDGFLAGLVEEPE